MKRLLFVVALAFAAMSFAGEGVSVGARAAVSYNDYWGYEDQLDPVLEDSWGVGFAASLDFLIKINSTIAFHPALGFSYRNPSSDVTEGEFMSMFTGASADDYDDYYDDDYYDDDDEYVEKITMTFEQWNLDIPLLLRINMGSTFAELGPMLSFNMSSCLLMEAGAGLRSAELEIDLDFNTLEFDLAFGLGHTFVVGGHNLDLDLRFVLGLTQLFEMKEIVRTMLTMADLEVGEEELDYAMKELGLDKFDMPKTWQFQLGLTFWFM